MTPESQMGAPASNPELAQAASPYMQDPAAAQAPNPVDQITQQLDQLIVQPVVNAMSQFQISEGTKQEGMAFLAKLISEATASASNPAPQQPANYQ